MKNNHMQKKKEKKKKKKLLKHELEKPSVGLEKYKKRR